MKRKGTLLGVLVLFLVACGDGEKPGELLYVAPYPSACIGAGTMQCLRVRHDPGKSWKLFYNRIEGFDYQSGYEYTLRVERTPITDPEPGGPSERYRLLEVVKKEAVNR